MSHHPIRHFLNPNVSSLISAGHDSDGWWGAGRGQSLVQHQGQCKPAPGKAAMGSSTPVGLVFNSLPASSPTLGWAGRPPASSCWLRSHRVVVKKNFPADSEVGFFFPPNSQHPFLVAPLTHLVHMIWKRPTTSRPTKHNFQSIVLN